MLSKGQVREFRQCTVCKGLGNVAVRGT